MKILIADDDYINRRFLQEFFSEYGDCHVVEDGQKALGEFIKAQENGQPYNLVCLDIKMPRLDGLGALKEIITFENKKSISKEMISRKLVITAFNSTKDKEKAFRLGCDEYVTKPINTEELIGIMQSFESETI